MAKNIKITSKDCGDVSCIQVNKHLVRIAKNGKIKFHNKLDGDAQAELKFFDEDEKGLTPLNDFCNGNAGPVLLIDNGDIASCVLTEDVGDYAFTVSAADHLGLDPIIIIEPKAFSFSSAAVLGVALIIVALAGFIAGRGRGMKTS